MYILSYDTSISKVSIALFSYNGQKITLIDSIYLSDEGKQAEKVNIMLNQFLLNHNISYNDLEYVVTTIGPGNFTSVRVGIAIAHALFLSTQTKIIGINSLYAIALEAKYKINNDQKQHTQNLSDNAIMVCTKASWNKTYVAVFDQNLDIIIASKIVEDISLPYLNIKTNKITIVGNLSLELLSKLKHCFQGSTHLTNTKIPDAKYFCYSFLEKEGYFNKLLSSQNKKRTMLHPLYIKDVTINIKNNV